MKRFGILVLVTLVFSFVGCSFMYSIVGSGKIIKENREISSDFSGIKISNHGQLYITLGDKISLSVEGDDNIIPHMITRVADNKLTIKSDHELRRGYRSKRGIKFYLTVKKGQLDYLSLTSHGQITAPELTGDRITIDLSSHGRVTVDQVIADQTRLYLSSHGDIKIGQLESKSLKARLTSHGQIKIKSGKVKTQDVELSSHGDYLAEGLKSESSDVTLTSHGRVKISVSDSLKARITSHGYLYLKGNPDIDAGKNTRKRIKKIN